jgi:hypothetical protein
VELAEEAVMSDVIEEAQGVALSREELLAGTERAMRRLGLATDPESTLQFLDTVNAALKEQALFGGAEHAKRDELAEILRGRNVINENFMEIRGKAEASIEVALYLLFGREAPRDEAPDGFYYLLDEHGNPVPTKNRWAVERLLRNAKARTVGKTRFVYRGIEVSVSTVFLVLNHAHFGGPPVLWETMIFTKNQFLDGYQERYRSRQVAEAGHALAVMMAQKTLRERRLPSPRRIAVASRRMQRGEDVLRRRGAQQLWQWYAEKMQKYRETQGGAG